jgi:hypothetical protein
MMKKSIFGLAAIALLAVGCAENATVAENPIANPDAIGFELGTGKVTRATSSTVATIQGDAAGFGIYGVKGTSNTPFIENAAYGWEGGTAWGWLSTDIEWPVSTEFPIDFYAYYPKAGTALGAALTASYTVLDNVANQIDHLAAQKVDINAKPANSKVTLDFKHILSKIDFAMTVGAGVTVPLQYVAVRNVANQATYNYGTMAWGSLSSTNSSDYVYLDADPATTTTNTKATTAEAVAVTGDNNSMILMPQNLSSKAWDGLVDAPGTAESYIEANYRVFETDGGEDIVGYTDASNHPGFLTLLDETEQAALNGKPLFVKVGYPLGTEWLQSTAYTYVLRLGDPAAGGGQLIDENFYDENGDRTDLPVVYPTTPGDPDQPDIPDPIYPTNNVIGFDVVVTDWLDGGDINL